MAAIPIKDRSICRDGLIAGGTSSFVLPSENEELCESVPSSFIDARRTWGHHGTRHHHHWHRAAKRTSILTREHTLSRARFALRIIALKKRFWLMMLDMLFAAVLDFLRPGDELFRDAGLFCLLRRFLIFFFFDKP